MSQLNHHKSLARKSKLQKLFEICVLFKIYSSSFSSAGLSLLVLAVSLLLENVEILAVSLGQGDEGLFVADHEDVGFPCGEGFAVGVLEVHNTDASEMFFNIEDLSDSSHVVASGDVSQMSRLVFDPFDNLCLLEVVFDGVSLVDLRMRESDGPGIVSNNVGDLVGSNCLLGDLEQLELGLSFLDLDQSEPALDVVEQAVVLVGLDH